MNNFYMLRPCEGKSAYEAIPRQHMSLDLKTCATSLEKDGYSILDAHVLMIAERDNLETTIYPSGKLLIKTDRKIEANETVENLSRYILSNIDLK